MFAGLQRSTAFRFTLIFVAMFSLAIGILGYFLYRETFGESRRATELEINRDIDVLANVFRGEGSGALKLRVNDRSAWLDGGLYMLITAPSGAKLAGNMTGIPSEALAAGADFFDFVYTHPLRDAAGREIGVEQRRARGKIRRFRSTPDSESFLLVFVARDVSDIEELRERGERQVANIAGATVIIGLLIGLIFARTVLSRVEAVNRTARAVRGGDLSKRVALTGAHDELESLAINLNAMLDQIERLMNGMREVSDNIAHDMRSPLTRIKNRLTAALDAGPAAQGDAVRATLDEAERMIAAFNALLSIARIESGEGARATTLIDLGAIAAELAELYEPAASEAGFTLKLDRHAAPQVRGSRELVSQAISNLFDNALKYAEGGTTITLSVKKSARGGALLSVADDGVGVPASERANVVKRFVRLESSRSSTGSGLGLSLVAAIARAHGAGLKLSGASPDDSRGLKVTLAFPPAHQG